MIIIAETKYHSASVQKKTCAKNRLYKKPTTSFPKDFSVMCHVFEKELWDRAVMGKVKLGRTGFEITRLGFGTLPLGRNQANLSVEDGASLSEWLVRLLSKRAKQLHPTSSPDRVI